MPGRPVEVEIVGLGRWARVLTRSAASSPDLKNVSGFSRSPENLQIIDLDEGTITQI
jgi:hypothetical protein